MQSRIQHHDQLRQSEFDFNFVTIPNQKTHDAPARGLTQEPISDEKELAYVQSSSINSSYTSPRSSPIWLYEHQRQADVRFNPTSPQSYRSLSDVSASSWNVSDSPYLDIPLADHQLRQKLIDTMLSVLSNPVSDLQLDWAEETLRLCAVGEAHRKRVEGFKSKILIDELAYKWEEVLRLNATQVLDYWRRQEHGRAYFLLARYVVPEAEQEYYHLLACGRGNRRSLYYLGMLAEKQKLIGDAIKRFQEGAQSNDAACNYRLGKAYLHGELALKKDRMKAASYMQKAADHADHDFPEPLYHIATLQMMLQTRSSLRLSKTKPLIPYDPELALKNLRKAALFGYANSQLLLGKLHRLETREGVDDRPQELHKTIRRLAEAVRLQPNDTIALHYLHLAARRGSSEADCEIARYFIWNTYHLSEEDARLAFTYARQALLGGVDEAYGLLGKAHEHGIGCKKDLELAEKYYYDGGKKGDVFARNRSDKLRNQGIGLHGFEYGYVIGQIEGSK